MDRGKKISLARRFNSVLDLEKTRIVAGKCPVHNTPLNIGKIFVWCPKRKCRFSLMSWERDSMIELMSNG